MGWTIFMYSWTHAWQSAPATLFSGRKDHGPGRDRRVFMGSTLITSHRNVTFSRDSTRPFQASVAPNLQWPFRKSKGRSILLRASYRGSVAQRPVGIPVRSRATQLEQGERWVERHNFTLSSHAKPSRTNPSRSSFRGFIWGAADSAPVLGVLPKFEVCERVSRDCLVLNVHAKFDTVPWPGRDVGQPPGNQETDWHGVQFPFRG